MILGLGSQRDISKMTWSFKRMNKSLHSESFSDPMVHTSLPLSLGSFLSSHIHTQFVC
jgi:hypothetical protein